MAIIFSVFIICQTYGFIKIMLTFARQMPLCHRSVIIIFIDLSGNDNVRIYLIIMEIWGKFLYFVKYRISCSNIITEVHNFYINTVASTGAFHKVKVIFRIPEVIDFFNSEQPKKITGWCNNFGEAVRNYKISTKILFWATKFGFKIYYKKLLQP